MELDSSRSSGFPPDNELAKRLFTGGPEGTSQSNHLSPNDSPSNRRHSPSSSVSPSRRDPLRGHYDVWGYKSRPPSSNVQAQGVRRKPRLGFCGAVIFFSLCLAAMALTFQFNSGQWHTINMEGRNLFNSPSKCLPSLSCIKTWPKVTLVLFPPAKAGRKCP